MTLDLYNVDLQHQVLNEPNIIRYFTYQSGTCYYIVDIPKSDSGRIYIYSVTSIFYNKDSTYNLSAKAVWSQPMQDVQQRQMFVGQYFASLVLQISNTDHPEYLYVHDQLIKFSTHSRCLSYQEVKCCSGLYSTYLKDDSHTYMLYERIQVCKGSDEEENMKFIQIHKPRKVCIQFSEDSSEDQDQEALERSLCSMND